MSKRNSKTYLDQQRSLSSPNQSSSIVVGAMVILLVIIPAAALIIVTVMAVFQGTIIQPVINTISRTQGIVLTFIAILGILLIIVLNLSLVRWLVARSSRAIAHRRFLDTYQKSMQSGLLAQIETSADDGMPSFQRSYDWQRQLALIELDDILEQTPQDVVSWVKKGTILYEMQRYELALDALDRALAVDPSSSMAWATKGRVLLQMGRHKEAAKILKRALRLNPKNEEIRGDLDDARKKQK